MSFEPVVPMSGYAGWVFLQRTIDRQQELHASSVPVARETDYFAAGIGNIRTAEDLVEDRRMLGVALGAFGLDDDLDNKFFIRKILEDGTSSPDALANRMTDKRYQALSEAFGFGTGLPPRTQLSGFPSEIVQAFEQRQFEIGVGNQNDDLRIALNGQRELVDLASGALSDDGKWFSVMGSAPLRQLFQVALGLPDSTAQLDLDQQLSIFRDKAERQFGDGEVSQFVSTEKLDNLVRTYLLRAEIKDNGAGMSAASVALSLLGG